MTSDSSLFVSAELDIEFVEATSDPIGETCAALRARGLVGLVEDDAEGRTGAVSAVLAFAPDRGLLAATADGVTTVPAQPVIDSLSAQLRAEVGLRAGEEELSAVHESAADTSEEAPTSTERVETIFVVAGELSTSIDRRSEIARQLESAVVAAPLGHRTLLAASRRAPFASWSAAQRPVIALQYADHALAVHVYSRRAVSEGPARERRTMAGIPDWMALWDPAPILLGTAQDVGHAHSTVAEVENRLLDDRNETIRSLALTDDAVLSETQIDGPALAELLGRPLDALLVAEVVEALRLPREVTAVVTGERPTTSLPGAAVIDEVPGDRDPGRRGWWPFSNPSRSRRR